MARKTKKARKRKTKEKILCQDCIKGVCKIHSEPPVATERPSWDEYFMGIARATAQRGTCLRHKLGAVLVKERRILATGYNGAPRGMPHCTEIGCLRDELKIPSGTKHEICRGVHAEQNTIIQSALHGVSTEGSEIYITHEPCAVCAKMLINAGVKRIVCLAGYPDPFAKKLLRQAKIKVVRLDAKKRKT